VTHDLKVTVLGSGTCTPSRHRQNAGYLLHIGTHRVLVDAGSGTIGRLMKVGIPVHRLDAIFVTHLHLDHTADLFPLLFAMRNSYGFQRTQDLTIYGPPGFQNFYTHLDHVYGRWILSEDYRIHVRELRPNSEEDIHVGTDRVRSFAMKHTPHSLAYRFEAGMGRSIALTGDADESPALDALLEEASLAIVDCSMPDELKIPGHLTPSGIGKAAARSRPGAILLSHFHPPADHPGIIEAVHRFYEGPVFRAHDLWTYQVLDSSDVVSQPPPQ